MEYTEEHIRKLSTEHGLSKEQIIEFIAEFKAYDTDRNGAITSIDLGVVNKVNHYFNYFHVFYCQTWSLQSCQLSPGCSLLCSKLTNWSRKMVNFCQVVHY